MRLPCWSLPRSAGEPEHRLSLGPRSDRPVRMPSCQIAASSSPLRQATSNVTQQTLQSHPEPGPRVSTGAAGPSPSTAAHGPAAQAEADRDLDCPINVDFVHRVRFTRGLFEPDNPLLREVFDLDPGSPRRAVAFVDSEVAEAWPGLREQVMHYAAAQGRAIRLAVPPMTVPGGEDAKNSRDVVDEVLTAIHLHSICRRSYVIAIGGGAMLDAVGFAAATAHRGVRLIRVPTTVLAQDDAAMGVKNGINLFGKKNFCGSFAVPWAVLCDEQFLRTLPDRQFFGGMSEAVKVAVVRDAAFFDLIERETPNLRARHTPTVMEVIRRSAALHLRHIAEGGDPFELREARPLDFGHWSAHRLESATAFAVPHGEAVGIGVALDALYSARRGLLARSEADRIIECLRSLGLPTGHEKLASGALLEEALEEFREHLGGRLTIALLRAIGCAEDVHAIDIDLMRICAEELAEAEAVGDEDDAGSL